MKSIYMDERWGILQQEKENGEPVMYQYEENGMRVIYPFIKRKAGVVNKIQYFDLATPRGVCGPWIENGEGKDTQTLISHFNDEFTHYCEQEKIIAEYIRFSPWLAMSGIFSTIYNIQFYGDIYCNDLTTDFFHEEYHATKRRNIRHAEKEGVEIIIDSNIGAIDEFLEIYSYTEHKYHVSDYYKLDKNFITKYKELFPHETLFAKAIYNGKVISAALILMGEDIAHYHFGAINPAYKTLQANSLLFYKVAQFAAQKGKKIFDLGSAKAESTLERFKKNIAKGYACYYGTKVRCVDTYKALIIQAGESRENYFPAYRKD